MSSKKTVSNKSTPTSKVDYSKGIMGSGSPTRNPVKMFYGSRYEPSSNKSSSSNTSQNSGTKGKHDKSLTISVQSASYWDHYISNNSSQTAVSQVGSAPVAMAAAPTTAIKLPDRDNLFTLQNNTDAALITNIVFEKLGAVELTKFTRSDTVEGINPYYNIISNLDQIKKEFDTSNLVLSQKSDTSLYNAFSIKLSTKIPKDKFLEERGLDNYIYIDENGSLIIELDNITQDELIEIEIDTNGTIVEVR
jgi:hypothetical protein